MPESRQLTEPTALLMQLVPHAAARARELRREAAAALFVSDHLTAAERRQSAHEIDLLLESVKLTALTAHG